MQNPPFDLEQLTARLCARLQPQPGHDRPRSSWNTDDERFDGRPRTSSIQVLLIQPGALPDLVTIPNELDAMQALVKGTITTFDTFVEGTIGVANDEALLCQMPPNRFVPANCALIFGPIFIAGDGINFHSPSVQQLTEALIVFAPPLTHGQVQLALRASDETVDWLEREMKAGLDE